MSKSNGQFRNFSKPMGPTIKIIKIGSIRKNRQKSKKNRTILWSETPNDFHLELKTAQVR